MSPQQRFRSLPREPVVVVHVYVGDPLYPRLTVCGGWWDGEPTGAYPEALRYACPACSGGTEQT